MKIGAAIALILAVIGMSLNFGQYVLYLLEIHYPLVTKVIWPLSTLLHGLPVIVLCIAILATSKT